MTLERQGGWIELKSSCNANHYKIRSPPPVTDKWIWPGAGCWVHWPCLGPSYCNNKIDPTQNNTSKRLVRQLVQIVQLKYDLNGPR
ncbi:hypothetical protein M514_07628 [Trichuris suis]|uniref:Uncharacterized protein n=1 Tax=Trichuris suis TaxID=68888 RepID=A0A085N8E7_9BILA|nr:hypothetical protein M513_07628 [Trichuris suis]KFD65743.1 hypothetical protein M514_07628 [Trichuris suis]